MNNYYKILQVDKEASKEIIEKAYKTLAKKYHPDLQRGHNKIEAENMMKIINEAYDVLSDEEKRKNYDLELKMHQEQIELQKKLKEQHDQEAVLRKQNLRNTPQRIYNKNNVNNSQTHHTSSASSSQTNSNASNFNEAFRDAYKTAYNDAYTNILKRMGYKIRYKKTWKDYLKRLIIFLIIILICFILWHIPFTKKFLLNIYHSNTAIKLIVDIIINIISSFIDTITNISLLL